MLAKDWLVVMDQASARLTRPDVLEKWTQNVEQEFYDNTPMSMYRHIVVLTYFDRRPIPIWRALLRRFAVWILCVTRRP